MRRPEFIKKERGKIMGKAEQIENNFMYHTPKGNQQERYEKIRGKGKEFAYLIQGSCRDSRESSLALTKLEEAVMWANAAIARNE